MLKNYFFSLLLICNWITCVSAQSVGIGTNTPHSSAKLHVSSTTQGFMPPVMTTAQRDAIASPAAGLMIFNTTINCMQFYDGATWVSTCAPSPLAICNCIRLKQSNPSFASGVYSLDLDSTGPAAATNVYCDMNTDGGGWMLVLNYNHLINTDPALNTRTTTLPLLGSTGLGNDESGTVYWGHASNAMMSKIRFGELRLYGITSGHGRVMNFKTTHTNTINYFRTGSGSCGGLAGSFTALSGHTTNLPGNATDFVPNQGDQAMPSFPFFNTTANQHWGIKGGFSPCGGNRWELDDFRCPTAIDQSTIHQIWVR